MIKYGDIMMRAHLEVMDDYLELAEEFGIGIELGDFCDENVLADPEEYARRKVIIQELLFPLNLQRTLHTPFRGINPHSPNQELRRYSRNLIEQSLDTSEQLGCTTVIIHSAYDEKNNSSEELDRITDDFVPFLETLLDRFEPLICLENIHDNDTALLSRIAEAIGNERFGLCMDVGHMSAFGDISTREWYETFGCRTLHNHWHDNRGDRDAHGPLGSGSVDWHEIVNLHQKNCPASTIALEIPNGNGIRKSLGTLKKYLK